MLGTIAAHTLVHSPHFATTDIRMHPRTHAPFVLLVAGEVSPARVLDMLSNGGDVVLVDVRTASEKASAGVPDLPSNASRRFADVEFASCDDKRLRSLLRDPRVDHATCSTITAASTAADMQQ